MDEQIKKYTKNNYSLELNAVSLPYGDGVSKTEYFVDHFRGNDNFYTRTFTNLQNAQDYFDMQVIGYDATNFEDLD